MEIDMSIFETMTTEERKAFNYVYNKSKDFERGIGKPGSDYHSHKIVVKHYNAIVPNWVRLRLQKFVGNHTIHNDKNSYLSFNISFGSRMSTQNRINFTVSDYIYNNR